jgi:nitroreductase
MVNKNSSNTGTVAAIYTKLGPNEKAIIDKQKITILRNLAILLVGVKLRLQFTGWLQYMLPVPLMLALFLIAGTARIFGGTQAANLFAFAGSLLLIMFTFDLVTVKFRLRFPEALPHRKDDLDLFDLMRSRRSCRSFQTRKMTSADYDEFMGYVKLHSEAPTIGQSPVRFEYVSAPLTVWPTVNATQFLVAIAPKKYDRLAVIDVGRSLQKIVMEATRMGLGTCWIGPGADHASIMRELGDRFDEEKDHIICVCAVGYKSGYIPLFIRVFNAQFYRRLPLSSLFFADPHFKEPLSVEAEPFNRFGRNFEICQWAPSSYNGQTTRCVAVTERSDDGKPRLERFDFYAATASRYYAAVALGIWYANWEMGCKALGIHGHYALLSDEERGVGDGNARPELPRYDLSWVPDENL